jgi:hypothetical protein
MEKKEGHEMKTDLDYIKDAVDSVLKRARKESPGYFPIPITGFTIMEWLQESLDEVKKQRELDVKEGTKS